MTLLCLHTDELKKQLKTRAVSIQNALLEALVRDARKQDEFITLQYEATLELVN